MIAINSNCSRVDAVKASAEQIKLEISKAPSFQSGGSQQLRAVERDVQSVDDAVRSGDAQKAELALSDLQSAVRDLNSASAGKTKPHSTTNFHTRHHLDVYA